MSKLSFTVETAYEIYTQLSRHLQWAEENRIYSQDVNRNHTNVTTFDAEIKMLQLLGIDAECGVWKDGDYLRVSYARINGREFVKENTIDYKALIEALDSIAKDEE